MNNTADGFALISRVAEMDTIRTDDSFLSLLTVPYCDGSCCSVGRVQRRHTSPDKLMLM